MKKRITIAVLAVFVLAAAVCAAWGEPLATTRAGNSFYLSGCELGAEGRISAMIRCRLSASERERTALLLVKQGVPEDEAARVAFNDFCLRYSADGRRFQRLYERYTDGRGAVIRNISQNAEAWYDTPANGRLLPARALLEAAQRLGVTVSLPEAAAKDGDAASLQSSSPRRVISAAALAAAFRADKKLFDANYENAMIQVRGRRGEVVRGLDVPAFLLMPNGGDEGILCLLNGDAEAVLARAKAGETLVVEGVYRPGPAAKGVFVLESCEIMANKR